MTHILPTHTHKLKLVYFPIHGRAMCIRLALAIGKIAYEEEPVTFQEWATVKGTIHGGVIPVLMVDDKPLGQSNAILKYVCHLAGLTPHHSLDQAFVDEYLAVLEDNIGMIMPSMHENDTEKRLQLRKVLAEEKLPPALDHLNHLVAEHGSNGFCFGNSLTAADLKIFQFIWWLKSGLLDGIPSTIVDSQPHLQAVFANLSNIPAIKHHLETFGK